MFRENGLYLNFASETKIEPNEGASGSRARSSDVIHANEIIKQTVAFRGRTEELKGLSE